LSIPARIRQHGKKPWWPKVVTRRTLTLPEEEERLIREAVLIMACKPCANRAIKLALRKDGGLYEIQFVRGKK
jgi:hypothetical protein